MTRKAKPAESIIAWRRVVVGIPAVETLLNSSTSRSNRSVKNSFRSLHTRDRPCPRNTLSPVDPVLGECWYSREIWDLTWRLNSARSRIASAVLWRAEALALTRRWGGVVEPCWIASRSLVERRLGRHLAITSESVKVDNAFSSSFLTTRNWESLRLNSMSIMDSRVAFAFRRWASAVLLNDKRGPMPGSPARL